MNRRSFFWNTGGALATGWLFNRSFLDFSLAMNDVSNDRVLIVIMLNGGNDGLNTVIPLDQYSNLALVRPQILVPESEILPFQELNGLHPSMLPLQNMFLEEKALVVQNVGYPNQNRSHFRSADIWTSGSPAEEYWKTGWLGRLLERSYPDFLDQSLDADIQDPLAITMGLTLSETCNGIKANYSTAVNNPLHVRPIETVANIVGPDTPFGNTLNFVTDILQRNNKYANHISVAFDKGTNVKEYPTNNTLADQLKGIARLLKGGIKTKVFICQLNGFDTHANQVSVHDRAMGEHAQLLYTFSEAVASFYDDLSSLGLINRVLTMTFSEFGRRIRSNDSLGTDHGTAAPLFLFGNCVSPKQVFGDNPIVHPDVSPNEGVPMQFDFRDVYGSILEDWLNVSPELVKTILHQEYQYLPLVAGCRSQLIPYPSVNFPKDKEIINDKVELRNFPNPFEESTTFEIHSDGGHGRLTIFDEAGKVISTLLNQQLNKGKTSISWHASNYPAGVYHAQLKIENGLNKTTRLIKTS